MRKFTVLFIALIIPLMCMYVSASDSKIKDEKQDILNWLDTRFDHNGKIAHDIWGYAELGFKEFKSSKRLIRELEDNGFSIKSGVADIPTAFVASWGSGSPVIGILGEYDALPGMSQEAVPFEKAKAGTTNGHGCGHHLFGTASVAAAVAVKRQLLHSGIKGTIRLYGTPAEEGGGGKVYMVRAGLFDDVDIVLDWHPSSRNIANPNACIAAIGMNFRFFGLSAHAGAFPERGRSALDAVEAMNHMVNMMREHIPMDSRIHYAISKGGDAPNIVPPFAQVDYLIRHPDVQTLKNIVERVKKTAKGAAMGTGTRVECIIESGYYNFIPNTTLCRLLHENFTIVGGVTYNDEEHAFADEIMKNLTPEELKSLNPKAHQIIMPFNPEGETFYSSGDSGDISWLVPIGHISAATYVPGTSAHTWQAVAAGGMSIGTKGLIVAAKTLAISALELYYRPELIQKAKDELVKRRGKDFKYVPLIGNMPPPLDYRN